MTTLTQSLVTKSSVALDTADSSIWSRLTFVDGRWDLPEWADSPVIDECAPWTDK